MRKLKLQMQQTVNGFVGGPNGELDWMTWTWDQGLKDYVIKLTAPVDCIVMGRKLAEGFIPYWANAVANPETLPDGIEELPYAKRLNDMQKVVFSKTLQKSLWENAEIASGSLADEITKLKNQNGGDIIVYGGADFAGNLIRENLIDELHLFINPSAIPAGITIFKDKTNLKLVNTSSFSCGIVVLQYEQVK